MNTIHSSSLAFYPVGYNQPKRGVSQSQPENTKQLTNHQSPQTLATVASTPTQIQATLEVSGLSVDDKRYQAANARALKALNSYIDTRNQPAQQQLSSLISGIDTYA